MFTKVIKNISNIALSINNSNIKDLYILIMHKTYILRIHQTGIMIQTSGFANSVTKGMVYPHGFENTIIVVENNTTTTATAVQRIFNSPIIYIWLLFIVYFVAT